MDYSHLLINGIRLVGFSKRGRNKVFHLDDDSQILKSDIQTIETICPKCGASRPLTRVHFYNINKPTLCSSCKVLGEQNPFYGKHHSNETKAKIRETHLGLYDGERNPFYGKHHSEATKKRLSQTSSNYQALHKNPFLGKCHSEASRRKISEAVSHYYENWSDTEREAHRNRARIGQRKVRDRDPVYYSYIKKKAGLESVRKRERYVMNKIEKRVQEELEKRKLNFEYSIILGHKQFDFGNKETRILIEVQGDYWHANPNVYKDKSLTKTQISNIERDLTKRDFATKHNMALFYIWEKQINGGDFSILDEIERLYFEIRANSSNKD